MIQKSKFSVFLCSLSKGRELRFQMQPHCVLLSPVLFLNVVRDLEEEVQFQPILLTAFICTEFTMSDPQKYLNEEQALPELTFLNTSQVQHARHTNDYRGSDVSL